MREMDLQCLFIGKKPRLYTGLLEIIHEFNFDLRVKKVDENKAEIISALKNIKKIGIVFVSDQSSFPVSLLSDLIWQYSPETIAIILTERMPSVFFKHPLNNLVLARLNIEEISNDSQLFLGSLIHMMMLKRNFRQCKQYLGVSEKRCQWLVDSSSQAIAYISRDLHLYANAVYLSLFEISSLQSLRATPVQELIVNDEHATFNDFVGSQSNQNRSLQVTMRKRNGALFRGRIMAIPSVFKGGKCLQLWVQPLSDYKMEQEDKLEESSVKKMEHLMRQKEQSRNVEAVLKDKQKGPSQKVTSSSEVLKGVISQKEAYLANQKLVNLNSRRGAHYFLTLKTPVSLKEGIEKLLFYPETKKQNAKQTIFWDKVKFARLLQYLVKRKVANNNLILRFNSESINDELFSRWFFMNLDKVKDKVSNVTFMFPSRIDGNTRGESLKFIKKLEKYNCRIALDDFSVVSASLGMLRQAKPDYVRLSSSWLTSIEGRESREVALAKFIRQLESKGVKIIAPCDASKDFMKVFTLAGASFCQERVSKPA